MNNNSSIVTAIPKTDYPISFADFNRLIDLMFEVKLCPPSDRVGIETFTIIGLRFDGLL